MILLFSYLLILSPWLRIVAAIGVTLLSMCICESVDWLNGYKYPWTSLNTCYGAYTTCRFTPEFNFEKPVIPSWVTSGERNIFTNTIERTLNGKLDGKQDTLDERIGHGWAATQACHYDPTRKGWTDKGCCSVNDGGWLTGYKKACSCAGWRRHTFWV